MFPNTVQVHSLTPWRMPCSTTCGKPSSHSLFWEALALTCQMDFFIIFTENCHWGRSVSDIIGGCSVWLIWWWPACQGRMPACCRQWPFLPLLWGLPVFYKCNCALKSSDSGIAAQVCAYSKSYTKSKAKSLNFLYCLYSLLLCSVPVVFWQECTTSVPQ